MEESVKKLVEELHRGLPPELQSAVAAFPLAENVFATSQRYGLSTAETVKLAGEITRYLSGQGKSKDFIENLLTLFSADRQKTAAVARDVRARIFTPLLQAMKGAIATPPPAPQPPAPPPPPVPLPKPLPAIQKPAPQPLAPKKPEPMIIHPLPQLRSEALAGPPRAWAPPPARPAEGLAQEARPAPTIGPTGIQPVAAMPAPKAAPAAPPTPAVKAAPAQPKPAPQPLPPPPPQPPRPAPMSPLPPPLSPRPAPTPPSPHLITREELQRQRERTLAPQRSEAAKPSPPARPVEASPKQGEPPLSLPTQPPAPPSQPERHTPDPYREPIE